MKSGNPGPHVGVQGQLKKGNPTIGYIMYRREQSWYLRCLDFDFSTILYMPFSFYDFFFNSLLGAQGIRA